MKSRPSGDDSSGRDCVLLMPSIGGLSSEDNLVQFGEPELDLGVGWHAPVAARGEAHQADLRAVGHAGALELLGEEAPVELL